ncbi:MAG: hypothetical protein SFY96_10955 [Planctomycetota bacterium]|nr:hypothetical protein [Planctomycetota bacterium]
MSKIALALVAGVACGMSQAGTIIMSQSPYGAPASGEFNATYSNLGVTPLSINGGGVFFETFCLEKNEYFNYGQAYNVTIDTYADAGGISGQVGSVDPLDERTAYLYYAFITGTLTGYDYANAFNLRQTQGLALQNAIWFLEGETNTLDSVEAINFFNFSAGGIGQGIGNVRVANLYDDSGAKVQSQIIAIPTPGALAGLAMAGVFAGRRRR